MADPIPQAELLALRRSLARLGATATAAGTGAVPQGTALRAVAALAEALRRCLVDAPVLLALSGEGNEGQRQGRAAVAGIVAGTVPDWATDAPELSDADAPPQGEADPDWDAWDPRVPAAADGPQTDAQRSQLYMLLTQIGMNDHHLRAWLHSRWGVEIDCIEQLTAAQSAAAIADRQAKLARQQEGR